MKKTCIALGVGIMSLVAVSNAQARDSIGFSVNIGAPAYYAPVPVYAPPPVYVQPPPRVVYYQPAPVYYGPRIGYGYYEPRPYRGGPKWHKHHRWDD